MVKIALKEGEYDSATMSAVHGAINALDALTTSYLGKRASGTFPPHTAPAIMRRTR